MTITVRAQRVNLPESNIESLCVFIEKLRKLPITIPTGVLPFTKASILWLVIFDIA